MGREEVVKQGYSLVVHKLVESTLLGWLAQLVRAFGLHPKGHRFESCTTHQIGIPENIGE